jgi:6-phosphofructokinase
MRIGLLTGGGHCPGRNAVIRAGVRKAIDGDGDQVIGFRDGWRGVLEDATVPGHVQRGGTPTALDRVLATRFGLAAIDAMHDGAWGMMVALRSTDIELVTLSDAVSELRTVPVEEYERYGVLFGLIRPAAAQIRCARQVLVNAHA